MQEHTADAAGASRVVWESLEQFAREKVQEFIQALLEEEVTALLGRARSRRRLEGEARPGYRNGYGKPRRLCTGAGTVAVRRPRVRGLEERFESRVLPLFKRRTPAVEQLLPELYLHGLAAGDLDRALRGLLGEEAPISAGTLARLKEGWQAQYQAWKERSLVDLEVVYLWVDGLYVKAGLENGKAALLVVIGALRDGSKVVLAVESGQRESTQSWGALLRDLKRRGMNCPRLVIGDGHLGIWGALADVYPDAAEQRCWNHRLLNVLDRVPKRDQGAARILATAIPYAAALEEAEAKKRQFQGWCQKRGCAQAGQLLEEDWERMVAFYAFPKEHWKHLRTTNVVESPFAAVRLRTNAAKRYQKVENATAVIWRLLLLAQGQFRRLDAPHRLAEVAEGAVYEDGVRVRQSWEKVAA
jgi:transposase-like protein